MTPFLVSLLSFFPLAEAFGSAGADEVAAPEPEAAAPEPVFGAFGVFLCCLAPRGEHLQIS